MSRQAFAGNSRPVKVLYFVGAGAENKDRVDLSCLFGQGLGRRGLLLDWYLRSFEPGGPTQRATYFDRPARICGRSRLPGALGRALSKLHEGLAIFHFFGAALFGKHDIVQVRDDFVAGPLGLLAARLSGKRFIFWLSYPFPEARLMDAREGRSQFAWYSRLAAMQNGLALYRWLLPHADHVFVQSEQMKRDVLRAGMDASRFTPVPMGLPDADLPAACEPPKEPLVLYLGTLVRVRRLEMVVQAFERVRREMPQAKLVFVGEGNHPGDRQALHEEVLRLGLENDVIFTGQLPREQALQWVRRAAVCLSPFFPTFVLRSTSPTKLVEYMALGKAVVANDHPEQAQIIADSGAGICTPWSAEAFAQAMLELLRDGERIARAGEAGRRWVMDNRLYSRIAADLLPIYRRLANRGDAAQRPPPWPP